MPVQITIPSPGESITQVTVGPWHKSSGQWVEKDETLVEIESDKVTLEIPAPESGLLEVKAEQGAEMNVGDVIGSIDPSAKKSAESPARAASSSAVPASTRAAEAAAPREQGRVVTADGDSQNRATPTARKLAAERGVDLSRLSGTGPSGRITKSDVLNAPAAPVVTAVPPSAPGQKTTVVQATAGTPGARNVRREKMTKLRQRIAERLVSAQRTAAMLTTFNEADMAEVIRLRALYKESFEKTHGVSLGFMAFFVKACVSGLRAFPRVNSYIVGDEIEFHDFTDISVAVGTEKGLVVPVLRNAEAMSFAEIEMAIRDLAKRAREGKVSLDEMTGGTFTISNGGVYGSLNSTPILNPPQSGILGMHKIMKRPVEYPPDSGQIALRPMMYLALSYDHRIVDGSEAVSFLVHVKQCLENPERLLLGV